MRTLLLRKSVRGFTLLEVVLVLAMFVVMMSLLITFFIKYNTSFLYDRALVMTGSSASAVMKETVTYTLQANRVLNSHVFNGTAYLSDNDTLVLELPTVDSLGNIVSNTYDYVAIYTSGTTVYRIISADPSSSRRSGTKILTTSVQALTFTYNAAEFTQVETVTLDVQTQITVRTSSAQTHLTEQIRLRNSSL